MAMAQHERRVVERYEIDTLGAPFKVTLLDCVSLRVDPQTGDETANVPDVAGLIGAVVRARVSHPRKLTGQEIRFVRNALGLKTNQVAKFLGMSADHFSRCETGSKVMAAVSERMFRLFAYLATHFPDPHEMLAQILAGEASLENGLEARAPKPDAMAKDFVQQFLTLKTQPAFDPTELNFEFRRSETHDDDAAAHLPVEDNEAWEIEPTAACG